MMGNFVSKGHLASFASRLAVITALAAGSAAAQAQSQDPAAPAPAPAGTEIPQSSNTTPKITPEEPLVEQPEAPQSEAIIVTGSRIQGASDSGAIAVTTLDSGQLEAYGTASTGEAMEYIAQAGSAEINSASDGPNDARGDVATVNLRGLGTGNTLILLNGRRIAAHAVNQDIGSTPRQITNVNAFPENGIDRIEVLRDGASALYGSDATAGVVNTILDASLDGFRFNTRYSDLGGTSHHEFTVGGAGGFRFNGGNTKLLVSGNYYSRSGLYASELDCQFVSVDKRACLGDSPFATETTDFRNTSTSSPFGQFQVGFINADNVFQGVRARQGTAALTNTSGVFHIQPCDFNGTRATLGDYGEGCVGLDDGNLDTGLRYDFNANQPNNSLGEGVDIANDRDTSRGRQLISEAKRYNFYAIGEHEFGSGLEAFTEALYYKATTDSNRAAQPLDSGLAFLIVPASNYWNPFGPIGSPNRLPGLNTTDVPAEGRDVLISQWRPTDIGPRYISTDTETYRILGGLRGSIGAWDAESAIAYSSNTTSDTESNRISKTLLAAELARSDPQAINPFGGPNANTQEQWNRVRISNTNVGKTSLTTADFRISNSDAFSLWAGPVGLAFGAEWRRDTYKEDRDPRLDGTIIFNEENVSGISDVVGVSPTRDSEASRNVLSAFGETLIPLLRGGDGFFVNELTLQAAVRGEYFTDINDGAIKPKVALSWFPIRALNFRAAYSQGFRVPNLVQLNRGDVSRLNLGNDDYYRADVTGDPVSTGDTYLASIRTSNPDLENEDTTTYVVGGTLDLAKLFRTEAVRTFSVNVDYWRFEQEGVIGAFGDQEALALDFLLRLQGSSNPNVVRAAPTSDDIAAFNAYNAANPGSPRDPAGQVLYIVDPYINLDRQVADGFDFGVATRFRIGRLGQLRINLDATYLRTLDVFRNELLTALGDNPAFDGDFSVLEVDRIEVDGNPRWRGTASASFRTGRVTLGGSMRYVGSFDETGADIEVDGETVYFKVKRDLRVNMFGEYRFGNSDRNVRVRLGVNNVFDKNPPLVDESLGYRSDYHSVKGREYYIQLRGGF